MDRNPQERETDTEKKPWSRETRRSFLAACLLVGCGIIGLLWCLWKAASVGNTAIEAGKMVTQSSQGPGGSGEEMLIQISELESSQLWATIEEQKPEEAAEEAPSVSRSQTVPSGSEAARSAQNSENSQRIPEQQSSSEESQSTQEQSPSGSSQEPMDKPVSDEVWISATGERYHSKSSCSGMKNPEKITLEQAVAQGYTPCKRCYRD